MDTKKDFAWGDGSTMQSAGDASLSHTLEICRVLWTNVTVINSIKNKNKENAAS